MTKPELCPVRVKYENTFYRSDLLLILYMNFFCSATIYFAFPVCMFPATQYPDGKEVSTNNCCKFMTIFIVFPGFCLKQLQQLFSDNS